MEKKNIIIVGAGFGGITAALKLARKKRDLGNKYKIILIDRHHHELYTPALYEIAAIPRDYTPDQILKSSILIPIADIIKGKPIDFLCDELVNFDIPAKKIILKNNGSISYEFLVLAMGSETNYFNIPGLKEYSYSLKTFDDALRLRNAIEDLLLKKDSLKIVVGGGSSTGVELIAEFVNFICILQNKLKQKHQSCSVYFTLIEASPDILPGFETRIIEKAKKRLAKLGVQIKSETTIVEVTPHEIIFKEDGRETCDILIWTGGVKGPGVLTRSGLMLSSKGSLAVNEYLEVTSASGGMGGIFAIGDNSLFIHPQTGKPLVWNVPVAEAEGRLAAKNILRIIRGLAPQKFLPMKKSPFILTIGKKYAIADLIYIHFSGLWGWLAKILVELRYLLFILPLGQAIRIWWLSVKIYSSNDSLTKN